MEKEKKPTYKDLYLEAWDAFEKYWEDAGIPCSVSWELNRPDSGSLLKVYVRIRISINQYGPRLLVHSIQIIDPLKEDIWLIALRAMLKAGASKIYESIVLMHREGDSVISDRVYDKYPLTPDECFEKEERPELTESEKPVLLEFFSGDKSLGRYPCPSRSSHEERIHIANLHNVGHFDSYTLDGDRVKVWKVDNLYVDAEGNVWKHKTKNGRKGKKAKGSGK